LPTECFPISLRTLAEDFFENRVGGVVRRAKDKPARATGTDNLVDPTGLLFGQLRQIAAHIIEQNAQYVRIEFVQLGDFVLHMLAIAAVAFVVNVEKAQADAKLQSTAGTVRTQIVHRTCCLRRPGALPFASQGRVVFRGVSEEIVAVIRQKLHHALPVVPVPASSEKPLDQAGFDTGTGLAVDWTGHSDGICFGWLNGLATLPA